MMYVLKYFFSLWHTDSDCHSFNLELHDSAEILDVKLHDSAEDEQWLLLVVK